MRLTIPLVSDAILTDLSSQVRIFSNFDCARHSITFRSPLYWLNLIFQSNLRNRLSALRPTAGTDDRRLACAVASRERSEEHTSELQSLMRLSYAVFCLKQ